MNNLNFLESEIGIMSSEESLFHIIPVPFEKSVSYGKGTANGPDAILKASQQLEMFDGKSCPGNRGIFTYDFTDITGSTENVIDGIKETVSITIAAKKIPVVIGGEHTVTLGAILGIIENTNDFGVIQFDAHADLRDSYEGSKFSHACVMRRIHEKGIPIIQIGTRSYSPEEIAFRKDNNILYFDAKENYNDFFIPDNFPQNLYLTIDTDVFDISLMPATGTPEPGGLQWYPFFNIIEKISKIRTITGFDLVEFSPIKGLIAYDFLCARLIYNMMGIIERKSHRVSL